MNIIDKIKIRAKRNIKRIVLPESHDVRVLKAAEIIHKEAFAEVILIGDREKILEDALSSQISLDGVEIITPSKFNDLEKLIEDFYEIRKSKGLTLEEARNIIVNQPIYFATMLVKDNYADGMVSGSVCTSADTLRPALQIIKTKKDCPLASSFFLMEVEHKDLGHDGCFIFADCGMNQNPTSEELMYIARSSHDTCKLLLETKPNIALLSHSTMSSSICPDQEKVSKAVCLAKENYPFLNLDGEMQFDAAIIPEVAKMKAPNSTVAGYANTLVFPDLDAGNIAYKVAERLAKAKAYGPITQGLAKPINDLSRGCSSEDIVGVVAITALQANQE